MFESSSNSPPPRPPDATEPPKVAISELGPGARVRGPLERLLDRWLPGSRGSPGVRRTLAMTTALAVVAALITAAVVLLGGTERELAPPLPVARITPAAAVSSVSSTAPPSELVVSVIGAVQRPGLVTLQAGARVADAVRAAGGAVPGTDLATVNLARRVADGEQVNVGAPPAADPEPASPGAGPAEPAKVDLNQAGRAELDTLPGVGEVTAQRILDWRTRQGRFSSVEQLREIDGIGQAKFEKLRDRVTV